MNRKNVSGRLLPVLKPLVLAASSLSLFLPFYVHAQDGSVASQLPVIKSARAAQSLLQDIALAGNRLVAVGDRGHIIYSDDNAKSWQQADVPTRAMLDAVFFIDEQKGWAVGHDGLVLQTVDAGKTWAMQLDGLKFTRKRMAEKIPTLEARLKKLQSDKVAADAQLADAENNGEEDTSHYEDVISGIEDNIATVETDLDDARKALSDTTANPLMDVWFRDPNKGFAVGAFGEFLTTDDGGTTWTSIADKINNEERHHLNAIAGKGNVVYIAGEAGYILRSTDGGQNWVQLESPDPENGSFFAVNILSADQLIVVGLRGAMYRSTDRGDTWKQIDEDLHKNMNCVFVDDKETALAVGNDGAFLRSRDNGRTFISHVRKNRLSIASVIEAPDGNYVMVGAGGVQVVSPDTL